LTLKTINEIYIFKNEKMKKKFLKFFTAILVLTPMTFAIYFDMASATNSFKLFDITFSLNEYLISNSNDLSIRINFETFRELAKPVNLTFNIFNDVGELVYVEENSIFVKAPMNYDKKFSKLDLKKGNYTLILKFCCNGPEKMFKANFEIKPQKRWDLKRFVKEIWFFGEDIKSFYILVLIILLPLMTSYFVQKRKGDFDNLQLLKRLLKKWDLKLDRQRRQSA